MNTLVKAAGKKLISSRKQKEWWYQSNLKKTHPSTNLEIKFLETIFQRLKTLESLVKKYCPLFRKSKKRSKRKSKRSRPQKKKNKKK